MTVECLPRMLATDCTLLTLKYLDARYPEVLCYMCLLMVPNENYFHGGGVSE